MENITAFFKNRMEMERAAAALRQQGAVDIKLADGNSRAAEDAAVPAFSSGIGGETPGFVMHVVVESSRFRQAEDTIASFGGSYL